MEIERKLLNVNEVIGNTGFVIKQFRIINNSKSFIFINLGTALPTQQQFRFSSQPSSTYISPPIEAQQISVFIPNPDPFNPPSLWLSDSATQASDNIPLEQYQYTQLPGFPFEVIGVPSFQNTNLPLINVQEFKNIVWTLTPRAGSSNKPLTVEPPLVVVGLANGNTFTAGGFTQTGGVFSLFTSNTPFETINHFLYYGFNANKLGDYIINCYTYSEGVDLTLPKRAEEYIVNPAGGNDYYFYVQPPGFFLSISARGGVNGVYNNRVQVVYNRGASGVGNVSIIDPTTITRNLVTTNGVFLLRGKFFLISYKGIIRVNVENLFGNPGGVAYTVDLFNMDEN